MWACSSFCMHFLCTRSLNDPQTGRPMEGFTYEEYKTMNKVAWGTVLEARTLNALHDAVRDK